MKKTDIPMLDLVRLHTPLKKELTAAFESVLESGCFIGGPKVAAFEAALSSYVGSRWSVGVSSGTDALIVALTALGVKPGDEVITSTYSFFATAGAIVRVGARPIFVDIDSVSFNIDPAAISAVVTPRTVGIVPVHLFGQCADMDPILECATQHGLFVLSDAAQSIGATYDGRQSGTLGDAGVFSFFPAKNLGALGDGGAVVTDDDTVAEAVRNLRQHGATERYVHHAVGGNHRLDALQAAFLTAKLPYLREWEDGRRRVADLYHRELSSVTSVTLPQISQKCTSVFNQFVIRCGYRDALKTALEQAGIASAIYYPVPLHLQPCFSSYGYGLGDMPVSEAAARESLALPVDPLLSDVQVARICAVVMETAALHDEETA